MANKTKMLKVYPEDWDELNRYLSVLQAKQGKRLSFADVVHEIVETFLKPELRKVRFG